MPPSSVKTLDGVFAPEREGEVVDDRAHLPALDGLRGVAVLLVVMLHLTMQIHNPSGVGTFLLKEVFFFGWSGVDLFFVLSGFLITGILDDAKGTTNYFRVFYARRMLRILPLYYGALLVVFVTPYLVNTPGMARFLVPIKDQLWYWFYLQNVHPLRQPFVGLVGHFWTLAIEEQFYLVWPVIILLLSRKTALWVCAAILPLSIAYRAFTSYVIPELGSYTATFAHLDGLAIGSALALLYRTPGATGSIKRRLPVVSIVSLAGMLILYTGSISALKPARYVLLVTFLALAYGCLLVYALEQRRGPVANFLRSKIMRFFGRYSYGMYVLHIPLISIGVTLTGLTPGRLRFFGSELGQRFINAYLKGVRQFNQGKTPRNLEIIARRGIVSADTARTLCFAPIRNDGSLDIPSLMDFQKWGVEQGHQIRTLSESELSDLEFVRKAAAALGDGATSR